MFILYWKWDRVGVHVLWILIICQYTFIWFMFQTFLVNFFVVSHWHELWVGFYSAQFQVHHGGAGTTVAGLSAAIPTSTAFPRFLIFVIIHWLSEASVFSLQCSVQQLLSISLVAILGKASACQRSWSDPIPVDEFEL